MQNTDSHFEFYIQNISPFKRTFSSFSRSTFCIEVYHKRPNTAPQWSRAVTLTATPRLRGVAHMTIITKSSQGVLHVEPVQLTALRANCSHRGHSGRKEELPVESKGTLSSLKTFINLTDVGDEPCEGAVVCLRLASSINLLSLTFTAGQSAAFTVRGGFLLVLEVTPDRRHRVVATRDTRPC